MDPFGDASVPGVEVVGPCILFVCVRGSFVMVSVLSHVEANLLQGGCVLLSRKTTLMELPPRSLT